jgi:murein DD-endopeptidase MepM/ murein hydrolase activator NlpD
MGLNFKLLSWVLLIGCWILSGLPVLGQGKVRKDLYKVKQPKIQYVKPDTSILIKYEDFPDDDSDAGKSILFNPTKQLFIVSEDTSSLDLGEQSIVEMSEEVLIDSTWIRIAGYFAIWDTRSINPYKMDGREIKDPVNLKLVDEGKNRLSKMPMELTPITSNFGFRGYRWHYGTDLNLNTGDSVVAAFDGIIRISKWDGSGYGNYVVVRHYNGLETLYGHFSKTLVEVGQQVKAGEVLGLGGSTGRSTGPHLHYEVRYQGNPIDPENLYDFPESLLKDTDFEITAALFNYLNDAKKRTTSSSRSSSTSARRGVYHKVKSGESLYSIGRKYGVSVNELAKLNGMSTKAKLQIGKNLRVK